MTRVRSARIIRPNASDAQLARFGKIASCGLIVILVALAIALRDGTSLVQLLVYKFNILVQLAPAFIVGIHVRRLRGRDVLAGLVVGLIVTIGLIVAGHARIAGIHSGLFGLTANLVVVFGGSFLWRNGSFVLKGENR